jgi:hypothetical protein
LPQSSVHLLTPARCGWPKAYKQTFIFPLSVEEAIEQNNEVRLIDLFVDSLSLKDFGFDMEFIVTIPEHTMPPIPE